MTFDQLVERAVQEPTLAEALSWVATLENERAIAQAKRALQTGVSTATPGQQWDTCFTFLFNKVLDAWSQTCKPPDSSGERTRMFVEVSARIQEGVGGRLCQAPQELFPRSSFRRALVDRIAVEIAGLTRRKGLGHG